MKSGIIRLAVIVAVLFLAGCMSRPVEIPAPQSLSGKYLGARDIYTPGPE